MKIEVDNNAVEGILNGFLDKCGDFLVAEAKIQCPVKTGTLQSSIEVKSKSYNDKKVTVGSEVNYALFVEMGHMTKEGNIVQPQPYLRPALDLLAGNLRA